MEWHGLSGFVERIHVLPSLIHCWASLALEDMPHQTSTLHLDGGDVVAGRFDDRVSSPDDFDFAVLLRQFWLAVHQRPQAESLALHLSRQDLCAFRHFDRLSVCQLQRVFPDSSFHIGFEFDRDAQPCAAANRVGRLSFGFIRESHSPHPAAELGRSRRNLGIELRHHARQHGVNIQMLEWSIRSAFRIIHESH